MRLALTEITKVLDDAIAHAVNPETNHEVPNVIKPLFDTGDFEDVWVLTCGALGMVAGAIGKVPLSIPIDPTDDGVQTLLAMLHCEFRRDMVSSLAIWQLAIEGGYAGDVAALAVWHAAEAQAQIDARRKSVLN